MNKFTDKELKMAHLFWYRNYLFQKNDEEIVPFLSNEVKPFKPNQEGWLKKARKSLFLSTLAIAEKLEISRAAYSRCEIGEETGAITLSTLAKAANAMNCELVYAIRPKNKKVFSHSIWKTLFEAGIKHPWTKACDQRKRGQAIAAIANKKMLEPKFRRDHSWSQRANKTD